MNQEKFVRYLSFVLPNPTTHTSEAKRKILEQRPKLSDFTVNSIIIPEEGLKMPQYSSLEVEWDMSKFSDEDWKKFQDNIMRTSFAFNMEYPPEDKDKIADFEAQIETKLKNFNENHHITQYSTKEQLALERLGIDIYSKEFQFISKIEDGNKYSFFDRCVLYHKIINKSNFLSEERHQNISNSLKDVGIVYPDYSKPHYINTYPLVSLLKIPENILNFGGLFNLGKEEYQKGYKNTPSTITSSDNPSSKHSRVRKLFPLNTVDEASRNTISESITPRYEYYIQPELNFNQTYNNLNPEFQKENLARIGEALSCIVKGDDVTCNTRVEFNNIGPKEECLVVRGPNYQNYFSVGVVCNDNKNLEAINKKIDQPSENNFIYNKSTSFAIAFTNKVLDEIMEDGMEKTMISTSLYFFYHYNFLSWANLGYYAVHTMISDVTNKMISKIISFNPANANVANTLLYSIGQSLQKGDLLDISDHIENITSYNINQIASDCGSKVGRYICKQMGGKIPNSYNEHIDEMKMIENMIIIIEQASSYKEFKELVKTATKHLEKEGKLSGPFISAFKRMNPLYDRDGFYDILQNALECKEENWSDFKHEIATFGFRTAKPLTKKDFSLTM